MKIDHADLIRKLPAMIQGRRVFAKMADGGNFHVGEPDNWCLIFKDIVTAIEDYCEYKLSGRFSLSAPVDGNWNVMNAYPYKDPFEEVIDTNSHEIPLYPGDGFFMNGHSFVYEKYENGNCILWDRKKDETFVYGYEELKQTLKQYGLELMKEEENGYEI